MNMVEVLPPPRNRTEVIGLLTVIILMVVLFLPILQLAVTDSADYLDHIRDARLWAEAGMGLDTAIRPHFFYHLLVIGVHAVLPGISWTDAALVVGVTLYALLGVAIYALVRPVFSSTSVKAIVSSVAITVCLMLITPITLLTWGEQNLYFGYIAIHAYHNPTQIPLKLFALLFFLYVVHIFSDKRPAIATIVITFLLGIASALSKPSYAICIIPAVGLFTLYYLVRRKSIQWRLLIIGFALPLGLVLVWQFFFHRSSEGGFGFDPFRVMEHYSPGTLPIKFVMSILFPAAVTLLYWRKVRDDQSLLLAWLAFAFGVGYTYLLTEPSNWTSGNFLWSGQITLLILFIVATVCFLRQVVLQPFRGWSWRGYVCAALFVLHVVSGLLWYSIQLTEGLYQWW